MGVTASLQRIPQTTLESLIAEPDGIEAVLDRHEGDDVCDLDKTWQGIHYLLTGDAEGGVFPLGFIMDGGAQIGDIDVGYGPARGFTAAEVKQIASALAKISTAEFRGRFDPKAMMAADIYPSIWDRDPAQDDSLGYLADYYDTLRPFIVETAERNAALLVYFC